MGLRFQKRIRLFKGLTVNLSKSGVSWTAGIPGFRINVGQRGVKKTIGIPGSGLSYSEFTPHANKPIPEKSAHEPTPPIYVATTASKVMVGILLFLFVIGLLILLSS
jgi:Protein of unknown function (DUF4236)